MPNRTPAPKKTTAQRGYDHNHKTTRARLLVRHVNGTKCTWCGRPMFKDADQNFDGKALHAHHPDGNPTRTNATELMHDTCNKTCGEPGTREHLRPTLGMRQVDEVDPALGLLVMGWP